MDRLGQGRLTQWKVPNLNPRSLLVTKIYLTLTMAGFSRNEDMRGIIPRAVHDIFTTIEACQDANKTFLVRVSYLQIYKEAISITLKFELVVSPVLSWYLLDRSYRIF